MEINIATAVFQVLNAIPPKSVWFLLLTSRVSTLQALSPPFLPLWPEPSTTSPGTCVVSPVMTRGRSAPCRSFRERFWQIQPKWVMKKRAGPYGWNPTPVMWGFYILNHLWQDPGFKQPLSVVATQIFFGNVHPILLGEDDVHPFWRAFFPDGLKSPTS